MKTSTRISLLFTLFGSLLLLLFGIALNGLFFANRYRSELNELRTIARGAGPSQFREQTKRPGPRDLINKFTKTVTKSMNELDTQSLFEHQRKDKNIIVREDQRILFVKDKKNAHFRDITHLAKRQKNLIYITLLGTLIFALLSYVLGKIVTRYALRDLDTLSTYVKNIDVASLTNEIDFNHLPDGDKIKTVAHALHEMQKTIKNDVDRIKRFVANVSHEFKTPLMIIQSSSELALTSSNYKQGLEQNIVEVKRLNLLLDGLLDMTHGQKHNNLKKENITLLPLVKSLTGQLNEQYKKDHKIVLDMQDDSFIFGDKTSLELILKNLLDNAYKYAPVKEKITITYNKKSNSLSISNTGSSISTENIDYIWDPFQQGDSSKEKDQGFGLGLALVKELVVKNGWKIIAENIDGVTFTIKSL